VQNRGGSVRCRRSRQRSWPSSVAGRPQPSQYSGG
jgi:hypothetical protein